MKDTKRWDDLLYIEEHLICNHFRSNLRKGFSYEEYGEGEGISLPYTEHHHLLMFVEGECTISCNQFIGSKFHGGQMVLIPKGCIFILQVNKPVRLLNMMFDDLEDGCDKIFLQSYLSLIPEVEDGINALPIIDSLSIFIDQVIYYLGNGIRCAKLHEIKHRELFLHLRWFYSKQDIVKLFYPIISKSRDFRSMVYGLLPKVRKLNEMIELSGMSRNNFMRRFKAEFGETAYQWMLKQIRQRIIAEVSMSEASVKEIMAQYNFSSYSNFNRFCKKNFNLTPSELIDKYRNPENYAEKVEHARNETKCHSEPPQFSEKEEIK